MINSDYILNLYAPVLPIQPRVEPEAISDDLKKKLVSGWLSAGSVKKAADNCNVSLFHARKVIGKYKRENGLVKKDY